MDIDEEFKLRLKAEMQIRGFTPASLSIAAKLNRRAVTDLLEGRSKSPKLSTAYKISGALGVDMHELTGHAPQISISNRLAEILSQYSQDEQEQLAEVILRFPSAHGLKTKQPPTPENS